MEVVYEDNHIIVVNKAAGEIVQGDKTGDKPLCEIVKEYLKDKYSKPGNVFCGVIHRLDRPVCGLVVFAKTGKALARMNRIFQERKVEKIYWAVSRNIPPKPSGTLTDYLVSKEKNNKSFKFSLLLDSLVSKCMLKSNKWGKNKHFLKNK